jgi:hypothetical protein
MTRSFVSWFALAALLATAAIPVSARANSLKVTITDVTTNETTSQTQTVPDGSGDYNILNFMVGSLSPPFQNVSLTLSGSANPPGGPSGYLFPTLSSNVIASNFTGATHEFKIVFDAETYSLPSADPVDILTQIDTNDARRGDTSLSSMTASAAGGVTYSRTVPLGHTDGGPIDGGLHAHTGPYTLEQSYDLFVFGSGNFEVKSGIVTTVVPEPAALVSAMIGLPIFVACRRFARCGGQGKLA